MSFDKNNWIIENFDNKYGTFVNNEPVSKKALSNGDVVFIMGLKIIIMGDSIFLNNPSDSVHCDGHVFSLGAAENTPADLKPESDNGVELYTEREYFSRAPRLTNAIECEQVKIDAPPAKQNMDEMPLLYVVGSMLAMGMMSMVSVYTALDGVAKGTETMSQAMPAFVIGFAMMASMILFPILNRRYEKKKKKKYEKERQEKYQDYIAYKASHIDEIMLKQRKILFENYLSVGECRNIILRKDRRLWERKIDEYDFSMIRLGIGDIPLSIDIQYPEEHFLMDEDNLLEILNNFGNKSKILQNVPITMSLVEKRISALMVSKDETRAASYVQYLIMQLITFQSYEDLKLIFLMNHDIKQWEYVKMLPHVWNNAKNIRFFADNYNDMKEISMYLEEELKNRMPAEGNRDNLDYKSYMPYYLIITDDYKAVENLKIISDVLKLKTNVGFSILFISNNLMQLPNECKTFISLEGVSGTISESEKTSKNEQQFNIEEHQALSFKEECKVLSNIPIKYTENNLALPSHYSFMEMYNVGRIEQLNSLERWTSSNTTVTLQAPLGIDNAGMPVVLDIHEKAHGPHGLIAGSTGSGKSEFIITYVLSLAVNYHPDDVAFILIDYKGGGLAGAFKKGDVKLPHLVGTITNIDTNELQRSLTSIQSELRRRQVMFNEARDKIDEGTIDIYKYQKLYHDGVVDKPIPHLLIICDEFAELKTQQSDFMEELIRVARIGRSLGVHLILATQKPAGIVDDQIRSNSRFGICLKVNDRSDSMDVIKRPDAADLKLAGQFYLEVGNDEYFALGQSAWAGAQYFPADVVKKKVDTSICFISNTGDVIKQIDNDKKEAVASSGEQLTNTVKYLYDIAKQEKIKANQLWLDSIPETIYIEDLRKKYHVSKQENDINPVIGEYDDPFNQCQDVLALPLSKEGNAIIFGNADSGKETLLSTIIYDAITTYSSEEVQFYLMDFGSEALKIFMGSPHVGDIVYINDTEKIARLFDMIEKEMRNRREILSDYNGDYDLYLKTSGKSMPLITVVLNNYEAFTENYEMQYEDRFLTITREAKKYGIVFILTASSPNTVRYRLSQNFKQKIVLLLNNDDDYMSLDNIGKKRPSKIFGRGLVTLGETYEFQTAKICEPEKWNEQIKGVIQELKETNKAASRAIPSMPDKVTFEYVKSELKDLTAVPIGIAKKSLDVFTYNFRKNFVSIIASKNLEGAVQFVPNLLEVLKQIKKLNIPVFDAEGVLNGGKADLRDTYNKFATQINNASDKHSVCVIIGMDKFLSALAELGADFTGILQKAEELGNYNFIIVDSGNKLKNHEYDDWYKEFVTDDTGIWVGNGIADQYLLKLNKMDSELSTNVGNSYGYAVSEGEPTLVKLIDTSGRKD